MSVQHVKEAQQALKQAGFYQGGIDGHFGDASLVAIKAAIGASVVKIEESPSQVLPAGMLTKNFSLNELVRSNTASKYKIDNTPHGVHLANLRFAATELFQPIRELLNNPIMISSGYRSKDLNKRVGGSATSAHSHGLAIDFTCPDFGSTPDIAEFLVKKLGEKGIKFDQIILEFPSNKRSWIHIGCKSSTGKQRGQVLTAVKSNGRTQYLSGLHY